MSETPIPSASPLRGRWLLATLVIALLFAGLVSLGFWQLARLEQRRAANVHLLERLQQSPVQVDGAPLDPPTADLRQAIVQGSYDFTQEIVLRNRTLNEHPGVHVLTPLRIAGSDVAVLVDRGWIPYELAAPADRAALARPAGTLTVRGILRASRTRLNSLSPADPPLGADLSRLDAWFRVDLPRIGEQMPYPLLALYLEEGDPPGTAASAATPFTYPRPAPDIELSEGSHMLYALQWFAFSAILLGGYILLYRSRTARP